MKTLVLLLLLANLTLLGYVQLDRWSSAEDVRLRQQIEPDKIKLLTPQQVAALAPAKAAVISSQCLEWGPFSDGERERAQAILEPFALGRLLTSRHAETKGAYWVYLPPLPSKAAADKRAAELRSAGISDLYVIQEGPQRNAISLGVFRSGEAAQTYLAALSEKGVGNARSGPRNQTVNHTLFSIRDPQPALVARLEASRNEFAGSEIKTGACDRIS